MKIPLKKSFNCRDDANGILATLRSLDLFRDIGRFKNSPLLITEDRN